MDTRANRAELEAWLILLRAPGIGASALRSLIERNGNATGALRAARRGEAPTADASCREWLRAPDTSRIAADLDWLALANHQLLTFDDDDFPALLGETSGAPAALFVVGDAALLWHAQIAIVGSRSASHAGLDHARSFTRALVADGFAITSGLAEGIDGAAHT
ncbi:MAG: DNA-processing protein DprA, partial [Rhodanobacteraceae bacterium]